MANTSKKYINSTISEPEREDFYTLLDRAVRINESVTHKKVRNDSYNGKQISQRKSAGALRKQNGKFCP